MNEEARFNGDNQKCNRIVPNSNANIRNDLVNSFKVLDILLHDVSIAKLCHNVYVIYVLEVAISKQLSSQISICPASNVCMCLYV